MVTLRSRQFAFISAQLILHAAVFASVGGLPSNNPQYICWPDHHVASDAFPPQYLMVKFLGTRQESAERLGVQHLSASGYLCPGAERLQLEQLSPPEDAVDGRPTAALCLLNKTLYFIQQLTQDVCPASAPRLPPFPSVWSWRIDRFVCAACSPSYPDARPLSPSRPFRTPPTPRAHVCWTSAASACHSSGIFTANS